MPFAPGNQLQLKHGHARRASAATSTYMVWARMIQRCSNHKTAAFKYYGKRGILVCDRWKRFENFLADMGERPNGRSLDRINNDGNYEPNNCRWATFREQRLNSRNPRRGGKPHDDLGGRRFGNLVAIALCGIAGHAALWRCRCDCGQEHKVRRNNLLGGQVLRCGRTCQTLPRRRQK